MCIHFTYIVTMEQRFGSSEIVGGFSGFLSGFLKGFSSQMSPIFSKMMIIMWRINFSIFLVQQRWQSKYSRFPTAQSSPLDPLFGAKSTDTKERRFSTPGGSCQNRL